MEDFGAGIIGKELHQIGGGIFALLELHQMGIATTVGNLHQAQAVALIVKPHRFGINRNVAVKNYVRGQIASMKGVSDKNSP
jgi:hypothetical protein